MRLIALEADDQPSFHSVHFRRGLTLIVGDSSEGRVDGTSNGVGKTLALGLVHHCLGQKKSDPRLKRVVPGWTFRLRFSLAGKDHEIRRTGDGKRVWWNEQAIGQTALRSRLNRDGPFSLPLNVPGISFRRLFKSFARYAREDCVDPVKLNHEYGHQALLRTLFLLGLDVTLVLAKVESKVSLDGVNDEQKLMKKSGSLLAELTRAGKRPKIRRNYLRQQVDRLRDNLAGMTIADDYRDLERQANELTARLRKLTGEIAVLDFQTSAIDKSLEDQPDLTRGELLGFFSGLEDLFKPEALRRFEEVETFHRRLLDTRKTRLHRERLELVSRRTSLEDEQTSLGTSRDALLARLKSSNAIDEYVTLARQLASDEEELEALERYLQLDETRTRKKQALKARFVEQDAEATDYLDTNPIAHIDVAFRNLAQCLYPRHEAGVDLAVNMRENKLRYDLNVVLQGDSSDGINAARILCFDWLILTQGAHHNMNFLWHDNRLFADLDPLQRARWFAFVLKELERTGKDYVATINAENLDAMRRYLDEDQWDALQSAVVLRLQGDKPENKLLGIQFEGS